MNSLFKILKFLKSRFIIIISITIGSAIFLSISVCATTIIQANSIDYVDTYNLGANNVQEALEKLNEKATKKIAEAKKECPLGAECVYRTICKRATTLHTEKCTQTDTSYYCSGAGYTENGSKKTSIITYGNLGTKGRLTTGDAFDCDVNGDGVYDSSTERFYYVTDMTNGVTTDSDTAVLIYYSNVSRGNPSSNLNSTGSTYDESGVNNNGPIDAIKQLPTTSQWSNVSLTKTTRTITNETGEILKNDFSYEGYAARLLTLDEVNQSCTNIDNYCNYLLEGTKYANDNFTLVIRLETASSKYSSGSWVIYANSRTTGIYNVSTYSNAGLRPVIEVPKSNISY